MKLLKVNHSNEYRIQSIGFQKNVQSVYIFKKLLLRKHFTSAIYWKYLEVLNF